VRAAQIWFVVFGAGMETLYVILDRRTAKKTAEFSGTESDLGDDRIMVLSAFQPSIWFSEALAAFARVPPLDPEAVSISEIHRIFGMDPRSVSVSGSRKGSGFRAWWSNFSASMNSTGWLSARAVAIMVYVDESST
jgi:hypothetical protein